LMGCTPSTPSNGTSRSPDAGADSKVAVFSGAHPEKGSFGDASSPTTFTCPSISDQENEEVTCGRLFGFNCCRHCHHHSSVRVAQGRGHKRISASLTGLHSLDPESTGLISQSGTCTPKPQLSSSLRSSCASLCSVCH